MSFDVARAARREGRSGGVSARRLRLQWALVACAWVGLPSAIVAGQIPRGSAPDDGSDGPSPQWFSLAVARSPAGLDDLRLLPEVVQDEIRMSGGASRVGASGDCIGSAVFWEAEPPFGPRGWPQAVLDFVPLARTIVVGRVREKEAGFVLGWPGTAYGIEIERLIRWTTLSGMAPADLPSGIGVTIKVGEFNFGGHRFCRRDFRFKDLPEIGERVLLLSASASLAPDLVPVDLSLESTALVIERGREKLTLLSGMVDARRDPLAGHSLDEIASFVELAAENPILEPWTLLPGHNSFKARPIWAAW